MAVLAIALPSFNFFVAVRDDPILYEVHDAICYILGVEAKIIFLR